MNLFLKIHALQQYIKIIFDWLQVDIDVFFVCYYFESAASVVKKLVVHCFVNNKRLLWLIKGMKSNEAAYNCLHAKHNFSPFLSHRSNRSCRSGCKTTRSACVALVLTSRAALKPPPRNRRLRQTRTAVLDRHNRGRRLAWQLLARRSRARWEVLLVRHRCLVNQTEWSGALGELQSFRNFNQVFDRFRTKLPCHSRKKFGISN